MTNHFERPAATIAALCAKRRQIELFFRWIKQNLRIKIFYGTSDNAVKKQLRVDLCVYVLVALVKKELQIEPSLYEIPRILSVTPFEQIPLRELLTKTHDPTQNHCDCHQLPLWQLRLGTTDSNYVDADGVTRPVEGERRYWMHVSIDRLTGQVIASRVEMPGE